MRHPKNSFSMRSKQSIEQGCGVKQPGYGMMRNSATAWSLSTTTRAFGCPGVPFVSSVRGKVPSGRDCEGEVGSKACTLQGEYLCLPASIQKALKGTRLSIQKIKLLRKA